MVNYSNENNGYSNQKSNGYTNNPGISGGYLEKQLNSKKSKCPKGAQLGAIGSCCGLQCIRACAIQD